MKKLWDLIISSTSMAIVAFFGVAFAIYQTYFYERTPQITIESIPPSKVLDIHQPVGGLDINYDGKNLRDNKQTLWLVNAKIINSGSAGIVKNDFDDKDPLGLIVNDGEIVDVTSVNSPDVYISKHLEISRSKSRVFFSPIILDEGVYFSLSLLILGNESMPPQIQYVGKIAGVREIQVDNILLKDKQISWWIDIFKSEYWWTQILRAFFYMIIAVFSGAIITLMMMGIISPFEKIKLRKQKNDRRKFLSNYKQDESISRTRRVLSDIYEDESKNGLIKTNEAMVVALARGELYKKLVDCMVDNDIKEIIKRRYPLGYMLKSHYKYLIDKKLIKFKSGESCPIVVDDLQTELFELMSSLGLEIIDNIDDVLSSQVGVESIHNRMLQTESNALHPDPKV
ncbi:hypothetical protein ABLV18_26080 [Klebsiella sp. CN_Kp114]|uniref:hypothetical protein n=1 Tax=unclassified Klebsiella TaxID=2608929 RepID=UPI0032B4D200